MNKKQNIVLNQKSKVSAEPKARQNKTIVLTKQGNKVCIQLGRLDKIVGPHMHMIKDGRDIIYRIDCITCEQARKLKSIFSVYSNYPTILGLKMYQFAATHGLPIITEGVDWSCYGNYCNM